VCREKICVFVCICRGIGLILPLNGHALRVPELKPGMRHDGATGSGEEGLWNFA
jgi:hypothetical protein